MALASRVLPSTCAPPDWRWLTTGTGLARLLASTLYGMLWNWFGAEHALCYLS